MSNWKEFFKWGYVGINTLDLQFQPDMEQTYQAFKARLIEEMAKDKFSELSKKDVDKEVSLN